MSTLVGKITLSNTEGNSLLVGELTRQTVMQLSKKSVKQLLSQPSAIVDLQQVTRVDTAGLAWLFYVLEQSYKTQCQLTFRNAPVKLIKLISLSGVEGFLPLHATNN